VAYLDNGPRRFLVSQQPSCIQQPRRLSSPPPSPRSLSLPLSLLPAKGREKGALRSLDLPLLLASVIREFLGNSPLISLLIPPCPSFLPQSVGDDGAASLAARGIEESGFSSLPAPSARPQSVSFSSMQKSKFFDEQRAQDASKRKERCREISDSELDCGLARYPLRFPSLSLPLSLSSEATSSLNQPPAFLPVLYSPLAD